MEPSHTLSPGHGPKETPTHQTIKTVGDLFEFLRGKTVAPVFLKDFIQGDCLGRFGNIRCPADTAVQVKLKDKVYYLHANTIKTAEDVHFIAAQAPHTNLARELYLKAALEQASVIVDLTNEGDNHAGEPSVDEHYPKEIGEQKTFSSIIITLKEKKPNYSENIALLYYHIFDRETQKEREITRIHYREWQDSQGKELDKLNQLIAIVNQQADESGYPHLSPMVNCRAGVGRTGTFITAATVHRLALQSRLGKDPVSMLCAIILKARSQRGPNFVQSEQQLRTLIGFVSLLNSQSNSTK